MLSVIWDLDDDPIGNVQHIAEHGFTKDDVEAVLYNPLDGELSRSTARPIAFGYTDEGVYLAVVFEWIDSDTVYPVTAFEVEHG